MSQNAPKLNRLAPLDPKLLEQVSRIVSGIAGIQLGERQRGMVETRLKKRLSELEISDSADYLRHLRDHEEEETQILVGLLTTHHTYFFREFSHFEYLETQGLAMAVAAARAEGRKQLRVWSAAASTGQEAYSLAMFLQFHLRRIAPDFGFQILGTDVDPRSIRIANNGVYHRKEIKDAPLQYLENNWVRGTGDISDYVKAKPALREKITFRAGNLLELEREAVGEPFDLIFCRNVFIYFNAEQIRSITTNLIKRLGPSGLLFIGISESLRGSDLPLDTPAPSIYRRPRPASAPAAKPSAPAAVPAAPLRVLCVDDSPSVHSLLKKILGRENGFEVVGTAMNGKEAIAKAAELKPDVMTLDIHMPEMTGVEYLRAAYGPNHPPVVMISSVSREDASLAVRCLELGASDYVEKPALANLARRGEEIRAKLGSAFRNRAYAAAKPAHALDHSFERKAAPADPARSVRVILANLGDRRRVADLLAEKEYAAVPTVILVEGAGAALPSLAAELGRRTPIRVLDGDVAAADLRDGAVLVGDFERCFDRLASAANGRRASFLIFGEATPSARRKVLAWPSAQVLVEDTAPASGGKDPRIDRVPATSFAYMANEFLGRAPGKKAA